METRRVTSARSPFSGCSRNVRRRLLSTGIVIDGDLRMLTDEKVFPTFIAIDTHGFPVGFVGGACLDFSTRSKDDHQT